MTRAACPSLALVDAHFRGALTLEDEHALREHWPTCDACRTRYQRQRLLAELDPGAMKRAERIGRPLGLRARSPGAKVVALGALAAAAAVVGLLVRHPTSPSDSEFASRGGGAASDATFRVYRSAPGGKPELVEDSIHATDELSFAVSPPAGEERVLVFATDADRNVYWYYPAWTREKDDPVAVPVVRGAGFVKLNEAIVQPLRPGPLEVRIVFTRDALSVRAVEREIGAGRALAGISPGAVEETLRVKVVP